MLFKTPILPRQREAESLYLLLGTVTLIAILDHTRMFFHYWNTNPSDLETTTLPLFFTRLVSHFFAPAALLVIGVFVRFNVSNQPKKKSTLGLILRGFILLLLELVFNNFSYTFDIQYRTVGLFFVGMLGICFIGMAVLQYLPKRLLCVISLVILLGHQLLDSVDFEANGLGSIFWSILHQQKYIPAGERLFVVNYTVLPWIAVFIMGYLLAPMYEKSYNSSSRRKAFLLWGILLLLAFFILRTLNQYGDPRPWVKQLTFSKTIISFFNVTKYPASVAYLCLTLGGVFVFLVLAEKMSGKLSRAICLFGSNFLFIYLFSTFFIHVLAMAVFYCLRNNWNAMVITENSYAANSALGEWGFSLSIVYLIWFIICFILFYCIRIVFFFRRYL